MDMWNKSIVFEIPATGVCNSYPFCSSLTEFKSLHSFSDTLLFFQFIWFNWIVAQSNSNNFFFFLKKPHAIAFVLFPKHSEEDKVVYKSRLKKTGIPIIAKKVTRS